MQLKLDIPEALPYGASQSLLTASQQSSGSAFGISDVTDEEILHRLSKRRSDATPIIEVPSGIDLRIQECRRLACVLAAIRFAQIDEVRQSIIKSKSPAFKAKQKEYNFRPEVAQRRRERQKERWRNDHDFKRRQQEHGARHFQKHKEHIYARKKALKPANELRDREYIRQWQNKKRRIDPHYNIGNRLRSRLWHAVTSQNGKKAFKTEDLIGCTLKQLRTHIESQFTDGMTWDALLNGKIHLDHKIPCSRYDLRDPEQQKQAFHWTNIQPLWGAENIAKSDLLPDGTRARYRRENLSCAVSVAQ